MKGEKVKEIRNLSVDAFFCGEVKWIAAHSDRSDFVKICDVWNKIFWQVDLGCDAEKVSQKDSIVLCILFFFYNKILILFFCQESISNKSTSAFSRFFFIRFSQKSLIYSLQTFSSFSTISCSMFFDCLNVGSSHGCLSADPQMT